MQGCYIHQLHKAISVFIEIFNNAEEDSGRLMMPRWLTNPIRYSVRKLILAVENFQ